MSAKYTVKGVITVKKRKKRNGCLSAIYWAYTVPYILFVILFVIANLSSSGPTMPWGGALMTLIALGLPVIIATVFRITKKKKLKRDSLKQCTKCTENIWLDFTEVREFAYEQGMCPKCWEMNRPVGRGHTNNAHGNSKSKSPEEWASYNYYNNKYWKCPLCFASNSSKFDYCKKCGHLLYKYLS